MYGPSVTSPALNRRSMITTARRTASGSISTPSFSGVDSVSGGSLAGVRSCADTSPEDETMIIATPHADRIHRMNGNRLLIAPLMDDVKHEEGQLHACIGFALAPYFSMTRFLKAFAISALLLTPASLANAQVTFGIRIGQPPPPPRWYRVPAQPGPGYEWIEGYWYP